MGKSQSSAKDGRGVRNREAAAEKEGWCRPRKGSPREREQRRDRKARIRMWAAGAGAEASAVVSSEHGDKGRRGAVPAEIVQDAAGNLHPFGLHDEDPQQEQCIPAPRGRGPRVRHGDSGAPESGRRLQRGPAGEGARPAHFRPAPSALDPPRLGRGAGRSPGT